MNCGLPREGERRDRLPVHERHARGPGPQLRAAREAEPGSTTRNGANGIARGRSYVSDGYAHAFDFAVNGKTSGEELQLAGPGKVTVRAKVAFSPETPLEPAYGGAIPVGGPRHVGDTVIKRDSRSLGSGLPARSTSRRTGRERTRGGEPRGAGGRTRACGRIFRPDRAQQLGRHSAVSRSSTRIRSPCSSRESPFARRVRARSGRWPASISSGACARADRAGRARRRGKGVRRSEGQSTAGFRPSRRQDQDECRTRVRRTASQLDYSSVMTCALRAHASGFSPT